jgi:N-acetylglucosamine malate deacetylase 2
VTILYVFPHPDDESFGPAPVLARQRREGHDVHLLTLTKGGATKQRHKYGYSVEEMGRVREQEMQCVARTLELSSLTVLDLPDGGMKHLDPREIEAVIEASARDLRPDVLVTYAVHGISGHPDHLAGHAAVKRVFCQLREEAPDTAPRRLALFTLIQGEMEGAPEHLKGSPPADIGARVTFSEADFAAAEAALACYETYQETVVAHQPLEQVRGGVAFELFGETPGQPLDDLFEALPAGGTGQS